MFEEQRELELMDMPYRDVPLSKPVIALRANDAVEKILENGNPLHVAENLSAIQEFIEAIKKDKRYVDYVREELNKEKGKHTTSNGTKIEAAEVGTKYFFDKCNDPIHAELSDSVDKAKDALKVREDFLKVVPKEGMEILHGDELIRIFPPYKTSTSSFKTTLVSK